MTILQLQARFSWTIPSRSRDEWRALFPNHGFLRGLSNETWDTFWLDRDQLCWFSEHSTDLLRVTIHATDGVLALFTREDGSVLEGHLANFIGPVAKEEIWDEDWDWTRNTRKIKVFKRKDGTVAIIPQDTLRAWLVGERRASREEIELNAAVGRGELAPEDFDSALARVQQAKLTASPRKPGVRARLLAMI